MNAAQDDIIKIYLAAIEDELRQAVDEAHDISLEHLHRMLTYHMGWQGKPVNYEARGKRIRPLLVLLSCSSAGGGWEKSLPPAGGGARGYQFFLFPDDIADHSALRRGRLTVWKKWGIAQAINTGDAMFTLAHLQPLRLKESISHPSALDAVEVLQKACLRLTQGQYLDLAFEKRNNVGMDEYWSMVEGKTAALISACTELGAISASCNEKTRLSYRNFGLLFGKAFQVQDDILGIWGEPSLTGKSNQSDLITRKKTLPVLYGLTQGSKFADRWYEGFVRPEEVEELGLLLENEGGKDFALTEAKELIDKALNALDEAHPVGETGQILRDLAIDLIYRSA